MLRLSRLLPLLAAAAAPIAAPLAAQSPLAGNWVVRQPMGDGTDHAGDRGEQEYRRHGQLDAVRDRRAFERECHAADYGRAAGAH